jgi:methylenetetrahydrofolate dehydrogenase (NADP+)/methenyltetrahydrofolate cyclohydrolase
MGQLIDGTAIAAQVKEQISKQVDDCLADGKRSPHLAVILVGDDERSQVYVRQKRKACEQAHITFSAVLLDKTATKEEIKEEVEQLNQDPNVDGIIIQLPLPKELQDAESSLVNSIDPTKDVDGLTDASLSRLYAGKPILIPATPRGILQLIESTGTSLTGAHVVVVGRGKLVGRPLAMLLLNHDATVTVCHRQTKDLSAICQTADILVVAVGQAGLIDETYIKPHAVVIDVGINVMPDGHLKGDCQFDRMFDKASWMTPVPKGVGPMTVAMLMANVFDAYKEHEK